MISDETKATDAFKGLVEPLIENAKFTFILSVSPLALIVAQLKMLYEINDVWTKIIATLAILSLTCATLISIVALYCYRIAIATFWYRATSGDYYYKTFIQETISDGMDERQLVRFKNIIFWPFWISFIMGWLFTTVFVFFIVWN